MKKLPKLRYKLVSIRRDDTYDNFPKAILDAIGRVFEAERYHAVITLARNTKTFSFRAKDELDAMRIVDAVVKAWWAHTNRGSRYDRPK